MPTVLDERVPEQDGAVVDGHEFTAQDMARLRQAIENSRLLLQPYRRKRQQRLRQYVGTDYRGEHGASEDSRPVLVNYMELAVNIYKRALAARSPEPDISTPHIMLKPTADDFRLSLKKKLEGMDFEEILQESVVEALFSIAVVKVGLTRSGTIQIDDADYVLGDCFMEVVTLDDLIVDMTATSWRDISFIGNFHYPTLDEVVESGLMEYDDALQHAEPSREKLNEQGDERGETVGSGSDNFSDDYLPRLKLMDVWLPKRGVLVTLLRDGNAMPLRATVWRGPQPGPYHVLSFNKVPSNIMPLPPAALWHDLHKLMNRLMRKLADQADRQRTILAVMAGQEKDGRILNEAADGDVVTVTVPPEEAAREYTIGGVDGKTLAFFLSLKDLFVYLAGNLDTIGGLSPAADTLGQERIIQAAASERVNDMRSRTATFARKLVKTIGWYVWTDPFREDWVVKHIPGLPGLEVPVLFTPEMQQGEFMDFNININVATMQDQPPAARLRFMMEIVQSIIAPFIPQLAALGYTFDPVEFLRIVGQLSSVDELNLIVKSIGIPPMSDHGPAIPPAGKSPVSNRTYTRRNVSAGRGASNANQQLMAALLGSEGNNGAGAA